MLADVIPVTVGSTLFLRDLTLCAAMIATLFLSVMYAIICIPVLGRGCLEITNSLIDISGDELTLIRMLVARWRVELAASLETIDTDIPREMRPGMKAELESSIEKVDALQEKLNDN